MNSALSETSKPSVGEPMLPEDADHSILQQPLFTGVKNVKQILTCIQNGSREVKDIILNECNIVYECKVCKNLFRSLANFLYHKRCFCKEHLCEGMLLFEHFEEPQTVVVQPEPVPEENKDIEAETKKDADSEPPNLPLSEPPDLLPCEPSADINTASESSSSDKNQQLEDVAIPMEAESEKQKDADSDQPAATTTTTTVHDPETSTRTVVSPIKIMGRSFLKLTMKERLIEGCKSVQIKVLTNEKGESKQAFKPIILKPIEGNKHAVFQEIEGKKVKELSPMKPENVKTEVAAECAIASITSEKTSVVTLSPPKEMILNSTSSNKNEENKKDILLTRRRKLLTRTDCHVQSLKCLKCDTEFTTLRTLYFHMMSLHSQRRMYYPCPFCKTLFVQMYGVTRHLIAVHGKTKDQIDNKMREAIRKDAIWKRVDEGKVEQKEILEKENDEVEIIKKPEVASSPEQQSTDNKTADDKVFHSYVKVALTEHQCSKCKRIFGRKSSQVSHQKFCIMNNNSPPKTEIKEPSSPPCTRFSYSPVKSQPVVVSKKLDFPEPKPNLRPKRGAEKRIHKDFVDSQTLKWRSANKIETTNRGSTNRDDSKIAYKTHEKKIKAIVNMEKLLCLKCNRRFSSFSNLRRHAAIHIGWTRFECKYCHYQSYNKSECRHHLGRVHTVSEVNVDKFIINLVTEVSQGKLMNATIPKVTSPKEKKSFVTAHKNKIMNRRKRIQKKPNFVSPGSSFSSGSSSTSNSKPRASPRKSTSDESSSPGSKRQRKPRVVTLTKPPITRKVQSNYKSVTTNCPTTIILSKTSPTTTVQMPKSASLIVAQNSGSSCASPEKSTRMSPRKFEVTTKIMTDTASKPSSLPPKSSLHFLPRIFPNTSKTEFIDMNHGADTEKQGNKKNRVISDWFIKKDKTSNNNQFPQVKRDSAPLIIGLVPALGNSGGLSHQKK